MLKKEQALRALERDAPSGAGLLQVLRRGTGQLLRAEEDGVLVRDTVSGIYLLDEFRAGGARGWLRDLPPGLTMAVGDSALAAAVREEENAEWTIECDQYLYQGACPPESRSLRIDTVTPAELDAVAESYEILTRAELEQTAARGELFAGHDASGGMIGFAGSHAEGSMGILKVLPPYRRRGYAAELELFVIRYFMRRGLIPFGQVETNNASSAALQRKLGLTKAPRRAYWLGSGAD